MDVSLAWAGQATGIEDEDSIEMRQFVSPCPTWNTAEPPLEDTWIKVGGHGLEWGCHMVIKPLE